MLTDAMDKFLQDQASHNRPKTVEWYAYMLSALSDHFPQAHIESLSADDLRSFMIAQRKRKVSDVTIAGLTRAVKCFFKWCVRERTISADPSSTLKAPRVKRTPKALTKAQVADLLATLSTAAWRNAERDRALILFALSSGCRASEILSLQICQINFKESYAEVIGKGNKQRLVGINKPALKALRSLIANRRAGAVFLNESGQPLGYAGLREILRRLSKRVGFHISPHMLRHTFGTHAALDGLDPSHIQTLMGHAEQSTTQIYMEAARQQAALAAHRKLNR